MAGNRSEINEDLWSSDESDDDGFNYLSALDNINWSSEPKRSDIKITAQTDRHRGSSGLKNGIKTTAKPVDKPSHKPAVAVKCRSNRNESLFKDIIASEKDKTKDNTEPVWDKKRDFDAMTALEEDIVEIDVFKDESKTNTNSNHNSTNGNNTKNKKQKVTPNDSEYSVKELLNKKKAIHEMSVKNNNNKSDLNRVKNDRQFGKAFSLTVYSPELPVMRPIVDPRLAKPSTLTNNSIIQKALTFNDETNSSDPNTGPYSPDVILSMILDWNVKWLQELRNNEVPLTLSQFGEGTGLKTCYESLEEYQAAYIPLILYETWAQVQQDYQKDDRQREQFQTVLSPDIISNDHFMFLNLQIAVSKNQSKTLPTDGYLCLIEFFIHYGANNEKRKMIFFGYIKDVYCDKINSSTSLLPGLIPPPTHTNPQLVKFVVLIAKKPMRINPKEAVKVMPIHYLRPTMRQIELIAGLNSSPLFKDILRPRSFTCQVVVPTNISINNTNFNESQNRAILGSSEALSRPYAVPKILFIQGPPGTGKTHTLIGIIKHIYRNWESGERLPRILICAPSNGAVDEIGRRLYMERNFLLKHKNSKHKSRALRIVRIGKESQIHPDVRRISFDSLIKDNADSEKKRLTQDKQKRASEVEKKIQKLDQEMADFRAANSKSGMTRCQNEMQNLMMELQKINNVGPKDNTNKRKLKNDLMSKADIILSTLNSSHQHPIDNLFRQYGADTFDCVIVDEASQCSEPELLMPLAYKMTKMILIGDPMQLPATVISKKASNLQFGRSLFERFFHYFREIEQTDPNQKSPILMLTEQYRMHPQICQFPSNQFYDKRLVSSPRVVKNREFKLKPYIVFDVTDTIENRSDPTNKYNELEANFVIRLLSLIDKIVVPLDTERQHKHTIGIITPYNGQKTFLINKLREKVFKNTSVEINTVDGFQGQERDIIILSAVRAFDNQNSNRFQNIGFLDSVQRMNVALTRAKYSMILCISARSLEKDKNWKALIEDASRRVSCRFKVPSSVKEDTLKQMLAKTETINIAD